MRIQELSRKFHRMNAWRVFVGLSMFSILIVFAVENLYGVDKALRLALDFVELAALLVLFVDLAVNFSRAQSKSLFLKENWFELLLFVPFTFMFEALRVYQLFEVMGLEAMPFMMRTKVLVKGGHIAARCGRSGPVRLARNTVSNLVNAPDRYRTMRYRGMLSFALS